MASDTQSVVVAVLKWRRDLQSETGAARAASARLRRASSVLDALMLEETLDLIKAVRQAESRAAQSEAQATLGRYMIDMKPSVNNALTSMLGNAELLLLEPGQLSQQSLAQIKTIHSMALRINEIMQRFSSLASEMREAENASQAETHAVVPTRPSRR